MPQAKFSFDYSNIFDRNKIPILKARINYQAKWKAAPESRINAWVIRVSFILLLAKLKTKTLLSSSAWNGF